MGNAQRKFERAQHRKEVKWARHEAIRKSKLPWWKRLMESISGGALRFS